MFFKKEMCVRHYRVGNVSNFVFSVCLNFCRFTGFLRESHLCLGDGGYRLASRLRLTCMSSARPRSRRFSRYGTIVVHCWSVPTSYVPDDRRPLKTNCYPFF